MLPGGSDLNSIINQGDNLLQSSGILVYMDCPSELNKMLLKFENILKGFVFSY